MKASRARRVALLVVSRVRERQAYAHETLGGVLKQQRDLDPRDAALATRLSYGVISTRGTLDEAVDRSLDRPRRFEPLVRDALAISAWELLFGEVEPHIAVHEGVELVRGVRPQAAGLANVVLRRLAEAATAFPWGDAATDDAALARQYGHPLWMTRRLIGDLGRTAAASMLAADNQPAPLYLAHIPFKHDFDDTLQLLTARGAQPVLGPLPGSIEVLRPSAVAGGTPLPAEDALVCDAAAQFAVRALGAKPGMRLVEIGAGRGTKSVLAQADAFRAGGFVELWAIDSHPFKIEVLRQTVERYGLVDRIHPVVADATRLLEAAGVPAPGTVDAVLVDAPCSGLGTLRRHPDKRWRLEPDNIETLAFLGSHLLAEAANLVRPGGFMVYSTCTLTHQENADVIRGFLASGCGSGFTVDGLADEVPAAWREFVSAEGWFQSVPRSGGPDGHFVARLRRA